jgi:hypothetical protein
MAANTVSSGAKRGGKNASLAGQDLRLQVFESLLIPALLLVISH